MNANTSSVVQDCESEPLYLMVDGDNDVYVNNFLMEQHQIDGLRFLFKQFNKKAPGVIVNFPASCGKSATVAIFLNAVTNVLKNPVLILCQNDADLEYWKEVLIKWSSYVEDDIVLESSNPFIKGKKVFIKKCESLHSYLRRRWSVIILKENFVHKDMFKHNFEADFRICITATDIKKDLSLLNAVYKWLYPKKVTNFNDFVAKENRPKEKFRKSVQLDFLLEDVAIRRYVNVKPFQADEKSGYIKEIENSVTENENNVTEIESHVTEVANVRNGHFQRSKQVNDEEIDEITGQAFILIDDHVKYKISDQNVNLNSILINNQLGNSTLDQNIILINDDDDNNDDHLLNNLSHNNKHMSDESLKQNLISIDDQIVNKRDQKFILINDQLVSSDTSHHNFIFMNDDQLLNQTDQNVILFNDQIASETLNKNVILIDEQISNDISDQNVILFDDQIVNETSNKNVIFIDEQISNDISNQNFIFMNDDQILNQTSDQNVILFNDQIASETLNKNVILIDEQISNGISDQNIILFNDQIVNKTSNKNDILIDEQISNGISNQNFIFMNDDKILNQKSDQNVILFNDQIVSETSNKNVILIDKQISNGISNQNFIFMSDEIGNEPFYQNVIVIDENLLNKTSDQKLILVNDNAINENSDEINEPILNESSNPNFILKNHRNCANAVSDQDVILINSDDEIETNINNNINDICTKIIVDNPPIISENNEFAADHGFFRLDSANNNRDKVNGYNSTMTIKNNNVDANEGHNSSKLEVESFLLEQKPVNRSDKVPRIYRNVKSKNNRFTELLNIDNNSKIELNEMKDLNDKDLLKEKLIESLHFNDSRDDLNEIKDLEETLIKDESTETESLNFENNSKLDLNKMKDLDETLIKEESVETESLNFEKNSKLDLNKIKDLEETLIKEESAETESLNFENNCKLDLNKMKSLEETLIKEEPVETESLNFENNLKLDLNETLVKEELTETELLNFEKNSKLDLNEIKDLRNQLIESLGFDSDVKVAVNEIKNSENKNISNTNLNEMNDLRNKHLLQKRLIESLGLNSDCPDTRKSVKENNNLTRLNEYKDVDNLIKEESTESLSFDSNCRFDKNEIRDLGSDLIKEESSNSSNEVNSSNIDPNEKKDLHNKNVLQKQLIESLGLDDVKDEIEETNDEPNDVTENMQNVVEQIATGLEDDEIIVIKIEPEDENVNIVSNKRKSDKSGKDLDSKISEMEEKALKKFKGSLLDSIF